MPAKVISSRDSQGISHQKKLPPSMSSKLSSLIYRKRGKCSYNPVVWCDSGCLKERLPNYSVPLWGCKAIIRNLKIINQLTLQKFVGKVAQIWHLEDV